MAYASKRDSTQGVAGRIAATLRAGRMDADLAPVSAVGYGAFVLGGAIYALAG